MVDLTRPPTEIEIAEVMHDQSGPWLSVMRRLAFQRDMLLEENKLLKKIRGAASGALIVCSAPKGRFGEDRCNKCHGCKLLALLNEEE